MRTRLRPENPHGPSRYGFAWEHVPAGGAAHLDFGCYDGGFLASLRTKRIARLAGVDASRDAVENARRRFTDLDVRAIAPGAALPFADRSFTSVTLLDVLEHVHEQADLLCELARVLADDGRLIVTVPRQYVFSFLDAGNLKFRFPRLHRRLFLLRHSQEEYERRYVAGADGLIGDVSARKRWHEHFSQAGLVALLDRAGFEPVAWDASGFFTRPLTPLLVILEPVPGLRRLAGAIERADARCFGSMNLFCVARKKVHAAPSP
jgi:SAM-dependent methyltransferase